MADPLNIILLGRSGSGKGTQAKLLVKEFGLEYIGTGDLLRAYSERDNTLARRLKETLAQGKLAPSWMPFFVWMEKLAYSDLKKGVLFDGSPRKIAEAKMLDEVLEWFGRTNVKVLLIDVPREVAKKRLLNRSVCAQCGKGVYTGGENGKRCLYCGGNVITRAEDNPAGINARLAWY
ncbi:nucleoside monophosphate kinase, partial [Candidatus Azambacteria bacterium]|nr:nucleoside monophosphate kinase [Candidatus Azambacteria bacterium]